MIASVGGIDMNKLKTGKLEHNDWKKVNEAMSQLGETDIYLEDSSGITVSEIEQNVEDWQQVIRIRFGIDYLQLINGSARYAGNRQQEVANFRSLKTMAMELKIPVIALAQLSKKCRA